MINYNKVLKVTGKMLLWVLGILLGIIVVIHIATLIYDQWIKPNLEAG